MDFALLLDQPDLAKPAASRRFAFGPPGAPAIAILNGRGASFEGGADEPALSLKWLPEGAADYRSEGRDYRLTGSTQLLLNRGQPYRMQMRGKSESFVLFFPKAAADAAWQAQTGEADPMPETPTVAAAGSDHLQQHLGAFRQECRRDSPNGEAMTELSCAILNDVVALAEIRRRQVARLPALRKTTRDELLRRVVRAETYLAEAGAKATLPGAARAASLSPFHLIRVFEAAFGATPLAYAATKRLERAHAMLSDTALPIVEIALAAGYECRNAFDRAFVRQFRSTPGAVRAAR
jgi:AraC-like DNA-binding protein